MINLFYLTGATDEARKIWNATIDKRPALIARCATRSDVVRSVNFARDNGLLAAVRSGGHNIAGNAVCDDGMVIDLSRMKTPRVDVANLFRLNHNIKPAL